TAAAVAPKALDSALLAATVEASFLKAEGDGIGAAGTGVPGAVQGLKTRHRRCLRKKRVRLGRRLEAALVTPEA
ncbi:MAG: hypothetical protein DWQ01_22455, partial [Planctomycetota bacterium]